MNERAFEKMAPRLRQRAIETSCSYGADPMEAEDTAQDVLLRLWQMHDDPGRFHSIEAVAVRMAQRTTLNKRRQQPANSISEGISARLAANAATPAELLEEQENDRWLERRLQELPSTQHAVLKMRQVEHRSCKEIAQLLGITDASVRTLLSRARRTLFEEIKKR